MAGMSLEQQQVEAAAPLPPSLDELEDSDASDDEENHV
eukprot:CAMPEP_0184557224 /NCGR_PEP_ID=MMETSP0199_2-20130426/42179_1 /TAXON_ID=1112570 /ORGANISM="Thraustochytrium sp., Strain LLF1b" /LENGTH=37 /DNA_ID= /DNA_START= /DNA_END= /DNA_ORIENTATION=